MAARRNPANRNPVLNKMWKDSMQSGTEAEFLKAHPRYANRLQNRPRNRALNQVKDLGTDVKDLAEADIQLENTDAAQSIKYGNASYVDPTSQQTTTFDENGNPVVETKLSDNQQGILSGAEGNTLAAQGKQNELIGGYSKFNPGDTAAERARIEEQVFQSLTRDNKQNYDRDVTDMEQKMYNRGIPLDPSNPLYQREKEALDKRYDRANLEARSQATVQGGVEQTNQYNMGLKTHQQGMSDMGTLQGQGSGYIAPTQREYVGPGYELDSASALDMATEQMKQGNRQLDIQQQQVNNQAKALNKPTETPSPFEA